MKPTNGEENLPTLGLTEGFLDDIIVPLLKFVAAGTLAWAPAIIYTVAVAWAKGVGVDEVIAGRSPVLLAISGLGMFLWPMLLLVIAVGGFSSVVRVDLILSTIVRTFLPYLAVCLLFASATALEHYAFALAALATGGGQRGAVDCGRHRCPVAGPTSALWLCGSSGSTIITSRIGSPGTGGRWKDEGGRMKDEWVVTRLNSADVTDGRRPRLSKRVRGNSLTRFRELFTEYASSLKFDLCFQDFDQELADLAGHYAPPGGQILLALHDGQLAGCVALRRVDATACEIKRLYVRPAFRGLNIGYRLATRVISRSPAGRLPADAAGHRAGYDQGHRALQIAGF